MDLGFDEIIDADYAHVRKQILYDLALLAPLNTFYGYRCPACMQKYLTPHPFYYIILEEGKAMAYCKVCDREYELYGANLAAAREEYRQYSSDRYIKDFYRGGTLCPI